MSTPRSPLIRFSIVAAYVAVFWGLLPISLWRLGLLLDERMGLSIEPRPLAWPLAAAGLALMVVAIASLRLHGRGLPVSALPPPRLVVVGPYRWVRHPIYVGFHLVVIGSGLALGSPGLAFVVGALFLPCWMGYALLEERGLVRRFSDEYRGYRREVGLLPRLDVYRLTQLLARAFLPVRFEGGENIPSRGGAILIANHACYADPVFLQCATWRRIHFLATAEAFRGGIMRWAIRRSSAIPLRRYRVQPGAYREVSRRLARGELVGIFVEGERSPLGRYQGALPQVAKMLAHLGVPVIPIGISGNYDAGPRWAERLRVRPVRLRIGAPLPLAKSDAKVVIDDGIRALFDEDPQRVLLDGLDRARLRKVLWRCPQCLDEPGWRPADLHCAACGSEWSATSTGGFRGACGEEMRLAELAQAVWEAEERDQLVADVTGWTERSVVGPVEPLVSLGRGRLVIGPSGLAFEGQHVPLHVPLERIRTTSTERADTLQVATASEMWQFRTREGSVFRMQLALDRWRANLQCPAGDGDDPGQPRLARAAAG